MEWLATDLPQLLAVLAAALVTLFHVSTGHH
jgi:hypothetical protein